jgi:hypothetical protein
MTNWLVISAMLGQILFGTCNGAVLTRTGRGKAFWNNHAVVICFVETATSDKNDDRADVQALGVVATDFLVPTRMTIRHIPAGPESAITANLSKGDTVVLCVERVGDGWTLPKDGLPFFPSHSAVQKLKDMDDPLIARIVNEVQKARADRK